MAGPGTPHQLDLTLTLSCRRADRCRQPWWTSVPVIAAVAVAALAVAVVLVRQVLAAGEGTDSMKKIAEAVQEGANAYLARQLRTLGGFAVVVFFLLMLLPADDWAQRIGRSVFFLIGAAFSAATGYIGMWLAVRSNVRVAAAAREATPEPPTTPVNGDSAASTPGKPSVDLTAVSHKAMKIAFRTGGVVGMFTVGLGLLGASCVVLVYAADAPKVLEGFGLGAALIAMFMRVGGGIFTKAADVGADLVGKVEKGIPEDDPRNAATIADNVGDNVGDCAGMAADLFESYAVTLVAALILGKAAFGDSGLAFPLLVPAIGVITAMIGIFAVAPRRADRSGMSAINRGFFISAVISLALVAVAVFIYLPSSYADLDGVTNREILGHSGDPRVLALVAVAIGIVLAALIQQLTGYFTETTRRPVRDVGKTSLTGPATVVLSGISLGLESAVYSAVLIGLSVYGAFLLGGTSIMLALFAVALAGHRPAHHGRSNRRDGHLRSGLRQRPGHRRDVRRCRGRGRAGAHRPRRGRQHHQGDHQGHRHRDGGARRGRALRLVPRRHRRRP
ncbi:K(+)-insensitive pyrophosphate-energized proton pump OS=Streptomyces antimycoticus OX=68175 GN=hppA PE=3 SV=1 [Streptomyces antimycoticus]